MQDSKPALSSKPRLGSKLDLQKRAFLIIVCLGFALFLLHIYTAFLQPDYSFVDDYTYVGAALRIVLGRQCTLVAENPCNYEHPPLAKLIMALGFLIFGKAQTIGPLVGVGINQLGGRFFQILMNFLASPILFLVVKRISGNWKMAFLAALFLMLDPLYYSLSLTGELDTFMVFFALASLLPLANVSNIGKWKAAVLSGVLLGLSTLSKESTVFILLAVLSYLLLINPGSWKTRVWSCILVVATAAGVFVAGLQLFDILFTTFPSFIVQLDLILHFQIGFGSQQLQPLTGPICNLYNGLCPTNRSLVPHFLYSGLPFWPVFATKCSTCWTATNPLDWLTYLPPVIAPTDIVIAPNYLLVWLSFIWVPLSIYSMNRLRKTGEGRVLLLALLIYVWNLASNLWIFVDLGRAVFEWYFLPAVPALAIGAAYILTRSKMPGWIRYTIISALIIISLLLSPYVIHQFYPQPQVCTTC